MRGDKREPGPVTGPVELRRIAQQSVLEGVPEAAVTLREVDDHPAVLPVGPLPGHRKAYDRC